MGKMHGAIAGKAAVVLAATVGFTILHLPPAQANNGDVASTYLQDAQKRLDRGDLRGAIIQLRNAVKSGPENGAAHYQLARVALELGNPVLTEAEAQRALDLGYDPSGSIALLGQAYLAEKRPADFLKNFQADLKGGSARAASVLVARGLAELALDDPGKARAAFAQARLVDPKMAAPWIGQARLALADRNVAKADADLNQALAIQPNSRDALLLRAEVLAGKGDADDAIKQLDDLITRAPGDLQARLARANMELSLNRDPAARADVDAVLTQSPGNVLGLFLHAMLLLRAQKNQAADDVLTKISTAIPRLPRGYYVLGLAKARLGQREQALYAASRYAARNPGDADGAKLYAKLQLLANQPGEAIQTLNRQIEANGKDVGVYQLLAHAYVAAGQEAQALHALQHAVGLAPRNGEVRTQLAALQLGVGQSSAAEAELEQALVLSPMQPHAQALLTVAALDAGDLDRAAAALQALKQEGNTEQVGLLSATLQVARLDFGGARKTLLAVLKDYPGSVRARLQLAKLDVMQDRPDDATAEIAAVLDHDPTDSTALSILSEEQLRRHHPDKAIALLRKAHLAASGDAHLTAMLAEAYLRSGSPQQAEDLLAPRDGATGSSGPPVLALLRAQVQIALKQTDQAEATYRAALAAHPDNVGVRLQLAHFLVGKNPAAAKELVADGLTRQPGNYALLQADVSIEQKEHGLGAALAEAARLEKNQSALPAARYLKGDLLILARRYDEAATAFAKVVQTAPATYPVVQEATALHLAGQPDRAAAVLRQWLTAHPKDIAAAQILASLDISASRLDLAEAELHTVLALQPDNVPALNNLAWIYQKHGDARAGALATRAYMLAPGPQTADTLGWILTQKGADAAGVALLRSANSATANPQIRYHLAAALSRTGQPTEAVALLRKVMASPASFPDKADAARLLATLTASQ